MSPKIEETKHEFVPRGGDWKLSELLSWRRVRVGKKWSSYPVADFHLRPLKPTLNIYCPTGDKFGLSPRGLQLVVARGIANSIFLLGTSAVQITPLLSNFICEEGTCLTLNSSHETAIQSNIPALKYIDGLLDNFRVGELSCWATWSLSFLVIRSYSHNTLSGIG